MEEPGVDADIGLVVDLSTKIASLLSRYYTEAASGRLRKDIDSLAQFLREVEQWLTASTEIQLETPENFHYAIKSSLVWLTTLEQKLTPTTLQLATNYAMMRGFQLVWPFLQKDERNLSTEFVEHKRTILSTLRVRKTRQLTKGDEIRLMQLEPGHVNSPLKATIQYCHLSENPDYEALSYAWGNPYIDTHSSWSAYMYRARPAQPYLFTDVGIFHITDNLHAALTQLRQPLRSVVLWVDAICIDQSHDEEKSWQIQKMREIYERASRALVWLGPADATSDVAMSALEGGYRYLLRSSPYKTSVGALTVDIPEPMAGQEYDDQMIAQSFAKMFGLIRRDQDIPDYPIKAAANLLSRAYWGRGWCWQEFAVAKKIDLLCGEKRLEDGDRCIDTFLQTWDRLDAESGMQPHALDHRPWSMMNLRRSHHNLTYLEEIGFKDDPSIDGPSPEIRFSTWAYMSPDMTQGGKVWAFRDAVRRFSMRELLQESTTAWLETGHKEDQIIALVGIATDAKELGIRVDCALSWETLYSQVAVAYLKRGDLWFLNYCQWNSYNRSARLPSWVPDWSQEWYGNVIYNHYIPPQEHLGTIETEIKPNLEEFESHGRLRLRGIILDEIKWTSTERFPMPMSGLGTRLRWDLYRWIRQVVSNHYVRDLRALWTVLIAFSNRPPLPPKYHKKFSDEEMRRMLDDAFSSILTQYRAEDEELQRIIECYLACMMQATSNRCVFGTRDDRLGLSRTSVRYGDRLAVFMGTKTAFVVRPIAMSSSGAPCYRIVAESYVYNLMEDRDLMANAAAGDIILE